MRVPCKKLRMCLLEQNSASKNWIKSADKITENHADFIIAVMGISIKCEKAGVRN